MNTSLLFVLLCLLASNVTAAQAATKKPVCAKSADVQGGCFWTKGYANNSADSGGVITLEEGGTYVLNAIPDTLQRLMSPPPNSGALEGYVAGEFFFCPHSPKIHRSASPQQFDWRYYGCIEDFKNATSVSFAEKDYKRKLCGLLDCSRPGFKDLRHQELTYVIRPRRLEKDEAAVEFEIQIKNGVVTSISDVPVGWTVSVANEPSWGNDPDRRTTVSGGMIAGALRAEELRQFHVHILAWEYEDTVDIEGSISTVVLPNFEKVRSIKLDQSDFWRVN